MELGGEHTVSKDGITWEDNKSAFLLEIDFVIATI